MQSQKEMHQKIQHPEVPSDPRASPEAFLRLQHPSQQTLHVHQLPPEGAGPAGVRLRKQRAPRLQPVRRVQPLGKRSGRPLHGLLQELHAGGVVQLQRLQGESSVVQPSSQQQRLRPLLRAGSLPAQQISDVSALDGSED